MSGQVSRIRVLAASPGDTKAERARLDKVVAELNRTVAAKLDLTVELVRWETHVRPGIGVDAQDVVNRQLPRPDLVVAMFWTRLGTPTARAGSGTAEEIRAAIDLWRSDRAVEILVYVNQTPYRCEGREEIEQLQRLQDFLAELTTLGVLLREYDDVDGFEEAVRGHLTTALLERAPATTAAVKVAAEMTSSAGWTAPASDHWQATVNTARDAETQLLVFDLRATLTARGFSKDAGDRFATVLLELLANVRRHADAPEAVVEIGFRSTSVRCVIVDVFQHGGELQLAAALDNGRRAVQAGEREHGLVKVERLASDLVTGSLPDGRIGVQCVVFDLPSMTSGVFGEFRDVGSVSIEYDVPKRYRLGRATHVGRGMKSALHFALREPAPRLLELYFASIRVPPGGWLGIEDVGNVKPSEPALMLEVARGLPAPRSSDILEAALEVHFHALFEAKRVVMHAFGTQDRSDLEGWAQAWDLPVFHEPEALRAFLRERDVG